MRVSVETTSGLERRLTIAVPAEQFENEVTSRARGSPQPCALAGISAWQSTHEGGAASIRRRDPGGDRDRFDAQQFLGGGAAAGFGARWIPDPRDRQSESRRRFRIHRYLRSVSPRRTRRFLDHGSCPAELPDHRIRHRRHGGAAASATSGMGAGGARRRAGRPRFCRLRKHPSTASHSKRARTSRSWWAPVG